MVSATQQATFDESMLNVIEMPETLVDFGLELSGYYIVIIHISTHSLHRCTHETYPSNHVLRHCNAVNW